MGPPALQPAMQPAMQLAMQLASHVVDWAGTALVLLGVCFFVAGTVGLLRFPDVYTRLHAVSKADSVGLGLVALGLALRGGSVTVALELMLVWLLVLVASGTTAHLIARAALRRGLRPWERT